MRTSPKTLLACTCILTAGCASMPPTAESAFVPAARAVVKPCFNPLADPWERNLKDWKDLVDHDRKTHTLGAGAKRFLTLDDEGNRGDYINLDYYELPFQKPGDKSLKELFSQMRRDFPLFVKGSGIDFSFGPYGGKGGESGALAKINSDLWAKESHTGAVMSFKLGSPYSTERDGRFHRLITKYGEVVSTCSTPTDFIFSTVESEEGNKHPVAGVRGFGLKDNNDGTWSFYSKASDRLSSFEMNFLFRSRTFREGAMFWDRFYANLTAYLQKEGLKVNMMVKNRLDPDKWPAKEFGTRGTP